MLLNGAFCLCVFICLYCLCFFVCIDWVFCVLLIGAFCACVFWCALDWVLCMLLIDVLFVSCAVDKVFLCVFFMRVIACFVCC